MASNANSSPDPDAAARRRSGRVVKAPDRLAPEPSQKRKRDGADEEDDMEDDVPELDEDESDVPDPESDEEPTPARKSRKASQSKRAKKPASKKPKINGTQPAAVKRTMTLPRMPKKPVRLDTEGKGNSLYTEIFGSGETSGTVAQQWLQKYRKDEAPAMLELINCVLLCVGCNAEVTVDDILDPDNIPNRLADLQDQYQEQQETEYPLISKSKTAKPWRDLLVGFFTVLIDVFHESELLYKDKDFIENVLAWLGPMSSTTMRPFRHTATTISLAITTGLVDVAQTLDHRITSIEQQLNASKRSTAKAKSFEIGLNLNEATEYRKACGENLQFFFDTVFVHRYRDTDPKIRCECVEALGTWIVELPGTFKMPQYLRYLGWMLSDANPLTRQEVLKQLAKIFKTDSESLGHFIERFRPRLVEMATRDADVQVRIAALVVIDTLRAAEQLEPDEIDTIGELIFDSELRVRKAVASFFVACVGEALNAKVAEIGGNDVLDELDDVDEDDFDTPRKDWLDVKCLAETLASYDARIEERQDEHNDAKLGVAVDMLGTSAPETRVSLAAQVLYDKVDEVKDWQILAGYLLHDHTTSSRSSKKKQKGPEAAFKKAVAPEPAEEVVLLKILASAVKSSLAQSAELDRARRRGQRMEGADQQEQTAIELASLIPSLLDKFASDPETATIVLRLEHSLNLGIFQQLRQDSSKYEKLLDEVCAQFTRHDDSRVIAEAAASLLHARQHEELEEIVDQKLSNLWETSVSALRSLDGSCELSVRGNLDAEALQALRNILIKISKLASIADCVDVMDVDGGDNNEYGSSSSIIDIVCQLVHRGKYEPQDEEIDELEDEVVSYAIKSVQFYFMWRTRSISKLLSQGSTISETVLNRLSVLRQTYRRFLIETLSSRAAIDTVRLFATGSLCDLHLTFATLRQPIKNFRPASSSGTPVTAADGLKVLTQEVEPALVPELISIFDGAEKIFAKKTKRERTLNRPADDEELQSEEEEEGEEDEDMDALTAEQRAAAQLAAEKALCELSGKFVMAISAKVLDNSGLSKGRLRRRMLRNQAKLGNNFKEVLNYLDEDKLLRKLGGNKKPSGKAAAQAPAKSAEVIEDDEDEENLYENSDKGNDLDEDPIEDELEEPEEEQQKNNDVDDDILGD